MCEAPRNRHLHSNLTSTRNIKVPLAIVAYIAGMLGFTIKDALGVQAPKT